MADVDIIEYMGQVDGGVFVLLSLNFNGKFYEGVFYYKESTVALTVEQKLEDLLSCEIEDWPGYNDLMVSIIKKVLPYEQAKNIVNDFDDKVYKIIYNDKQ